MACVLRNCGKIGFYLLLRLRYEGLREAKRLPYGGDAAQDFCRTIGFRCRGRVSRPGAEIGLYLLLRLRGVS